MSLDGFIAGPNVSPEFPMGEGGEQLHDWLFNKKSGIDTEVIKELREALKDAKQYTYKKSWND